MALKQGGAAATLGNHKAYFPADIFNGVLEVVTPDGKHLKSRPLGVSFDDGSQSVWIGMLKHSIGYLTSSNTVTYFDAFEGIKADIVATYRRGGFECDVVFRENPKSPNAYGLSEGSTLQMITEFFNAPEPEKIPGQSDEWYGLQDSTLKFGELRMTQGKAFAVPAANGKRNTAAAVYKSWLHIRGRTFLVEQLPLEVIAAELQTLPETAAFQDPRRQTPDPILHTVSASRLLPPLREIMADTNQVLVASVDLNKQPGVVMDYVEILDSSLTDYTFESDTTYYISSEVNLDGLTTFMGAAVLKFPEDGSGGLNIYSNVVWDTSAEQLAIFTSVNDDSMGAILPSSTGTPSMGITTYLRGSGFQIHGARFSYAGGAIWSVDSGFNVMPVSCRNVQFADCSYGILGAEIELQNVLVSHCQYLGDSWSLTGNNVTFDHCEYGIIYAGSAFLTNCVIANTANIAWEWGESGPVDGAGDYEVAGNYNGFYESSPFGDNQTIASASPFQDTSSGNYYLVTDGTFRDVGTPDIDAGLLAELQTMTTYAPQDGGYADTNAPDLGYHYPVGVVTDYDALPDAWEMAQFGNLNQTPSGENGDYDGDGVSNLQEYLNGTDPNTISFSVRLGNQRFTTTNATGSFLVFSGVPSYKTILVNNTNFNGTAWQTYSTNISFMLGSTDGVYQVWFGLKGRASNSVPTWLGTEVYLDRGTPTIFITAPTNATVTQPVIQLQGYSTEELGSVSCVLSNATGLQTNLMCFLTTGDYDTNAVLQRAHFQCYDVELADGANLLMLQARDKAGNTFTTNIIRTLDYGAATNPVLRLTWPQNGSEVCQSNFTLRGWVNDATVSVSASITDTNGNTNIVMGVMERSGVLWVDNMPLHSGTNTVTLTVTNAAGLGSATNFYVVKSSMVLALSSVDGSLWNPTVTAHGIVSDHTAAVYVNGVQATNNGDGTWTGYHVPVSQGGMAIFDMNAIPVGEDDPTSSDALEKSPEIRLVSGRWDEQTDVRNLAFDELFNNMTQHWNWNETNGGFAMRRTYRTDRDPFSQLYEGAILPERWIPYLHDKYEQPGCPECEWDEYYSTEGIYDFSYFLPLGWAQDLPQENGKVEVKNPAPGTNNSYMNFMRSAKDVKVVLHTGGRGLKRQSLFAVSGSAQEEVAKIADWNAWVEDGTNAIPFTGIKVPGLGKNLGVDGIAWAVLADDSDVDVTFEAGRPLYRFTASPWISRNTR